MVNESKAEVLKTSDLFAAAYLIVKGFQLIKPPYLNRKGYVVYAFKRTPELEDAWNHLTNRSDLLEPLSVMEQYRALRDQAWEMRKRLIDMGGLGGGQDDNE
jgi:hypothetical protein